MHRDDSHDLSDDADYAASKLHGSVGMARSSSSKQVTLSADEGAEIVYKKDNVAIHPTRYASERISGRLKLIKQGVSLFMTWVPYKGNNSRLSEEDRNLYAIRAVSFSEISSIRRQTPALGWHYIIVVLSSGMAFPPLYFYNGGVREFVATIKKHVNLVRSVEDANVFLLNDFQDPLQRTLTSLDLPRVVSISKSSSPSVLAVESPTSADQDGMVRVSSDDSSNHQHNGKHRQKYNDHTCDLSIQVLEKFSYVTKFARDTTTQLFREHGDGFVSNERDKLAHKSNDDPHSHPITEEKDPPEVPVPSDPLVAELEKSSLLWGKPRQEPLGSEEWASFLDSQGRVLDSGALKERVFYGGVEQGIRQEIWPFLLEYHACDSTYAERDYLVATKNVEYETIKSQWKSITPQQERRFTKFKERKSLIEKDVVRTDRSISFYDEDDNPNITLLHDILLTYSFYNFDLGYCQGMSDLLSPILFVMKDESESFWCFVSLMERLGPNFNRDQNGMHSQFFALSKLVEILDSPLHNYFQQNDCLNYFFCFRWILIQFKREFEFDTTLLLWEVLWTHHLSEHLHLYVCVAVLKQHRTKIMGEQMEFDTLLKYINELSDHIDLDATLREAEALCIYAGENGAACIPPGTPPSLPIEDVSEHPQLEDDVL